MKQFVKSVGVGLFISLIVGMLFGWIWLIEGADEMMP